MALELFAGARVSDFAAALEWYERLLGAEPAFFPHETEAVWELGEHRHVYIEERADRAGGGLITLVVDDLDARVEAAAARGVEPADRETYSNGVRKALYRDSDGNEIGFGGPPDPA
jgi:catechol 2,3-dioxygenase-like lactoylglutathione lyase family enzyme